MLVLQHKYKLDLPEQQHRTERRLLSPIYRNCASAETISYYEENTPVN